MQSKADYRLLVYFIVLIVFGLIMLTSASTAVGHQKFGDVYFFIKRQLIYGLVPGLLFFLLLAKLNYKSIRSFSFLFFVFINVLLLLVLIPGIGSTYNTTSRSWFVIGGYSFQPSELAKLGLIIYLAAYLSVRGKKLLDFKSGFLTALLIGMVPIGLIVLQPDVGTAAIMFVILFGMLFIAGVRLSHIMGLALVGLAGFVLLITIAPYRAARFTTFLHPELDPQGIGYQVNQAFLAIGSGGLLGRGLGHSVQKFQYLPEVAADSIFAVIAEEMGFFVSVIFVILLLLIILRGFKIAREANDQFGKLLVCGIIIWFGVQSFLNIGAMVGIMPLTGIPLPFVSHGGSALAIAMGAVGILVNVSAQSRA